MCCRTTGQKKVITDWKGTMSPKHKTTLKGWSGKYSTNACIHQEEWNGLWWTTQVEKAKATWKKTTHKLFALACPGGQSSEEVKDSAKWSGLAYKCQPAAWKNLIFLPGLPAEEKSPRPNNTFWIFLKAHVDIKMKPHSCPSLLPRLAQFFMQIVPISLISALISPDQYHFSYLPHLPPPTNWTSGLDPIFFTPPPNHWGISFSPAAFPFQVGYIK